MSAPRSALNVRSMGGGTVTAGDYVPFTPGFHWTLHPSGDPLAGFSADYRIERARDDGFLRIERAIQPVAVSASERDYQVQSSADRKTQPRVPRLGLGRPTGPGAQGLLQGAVRRPGRANMGARVHRGPRGRGTVADDLRSQPASWKESTRFDVFEEDGTCQGAVVAPDEWSGRFEPVFDRDHVWWVTVDELGVQRVVRYRIRLS